MTNILSEQQLGNFQEAVCFLSSARTRKIRAPPSLKTLQMMNVSKQQRPILQYILKNKSVEDKQCVGSAHRNYGRFVF